MRRKQLYNHFAQLKKKRTRVSSGAMQMNECDLLSSFHKHMAQFTLPRERVRISTLCEVQTPSDSKPSVDPQIKVLYPTHHPPPLLSAWWLWALWHREQFVKMHSPGCPSALTALPISLCLAIMFRGRERCDHIGSVSKAKLRKSEVISTFCHRCPFLFARLGPHCAGVTVGGTSPFRFLDLGTTAHQALNFSHGDV